MKVNESVNKNKKIEISGKDFLKGTDFINSVIHEYLLKKEYYKTLDTFQEEVNNKIKANTYATQKANEDNLGEHHLYQNFNTGKKTEFFTLWSRLIPSHIRNREKQLLRLEFFLNVYFSLYPVLPHVVEKKNIKESNLKEMRSRLQNFKSYLDQKEVEMSKTTEILAFYALPYINNPMEHPAYKHIFTIEWIKDIKEKLRHSLNMYIPNGKYPLIYDLYFSFIHGYDGKNHLHFNFSDKNKSDNLKGVEKSQDITYLQEEYIKLKKREESTKVTLIECQKKWNNFSLDILNISFDLINSINKEKAGIDLPPYYIDTINTRLSKYDSFLKKNAENLDKGSLSVSRDNIRDLNDDKHNTSLNNKSVNIDQKDNKSVDLKTLNNSGSHDLNYLNSINASDHMFDINSINELFKNFNTDMSYTEKVNYILREFRCRLTQKKHMKIKSLTINSIIFNDLLGLKNPYSNVLVNLLCNEYTCSETLKLLNTLTNENIGRTYLLLKNIVIDKIVEIMMHQEGDTEIRQNCLGIIQKFTLRSAPQKLLIDLDVIMWITSVFISETNFLSDYTLEYGLALLMNVSLRSYGRDKCEAVSRQILKFLSMNIYHESIQVRTCINGTLYSLLKRKKFRNEAREMGLENILNKQLQNPNEQMKKQIQYILEELNSENELDDNNDEEFEDENYKDDEEIYDEDLIDEDSINEDQLSMHYEIISQYLIKSETNNKKEIDFINKFMTNQVHIGDSVGDNNNVRRDDINMPLRRPTTPMTNLSSSTSNSQIFLGEKKSNIAKNRSIPKSTKKRNINNVSNSVNNIAINNSNNLNNSINNINNLNTSNNKSNQNNLNNLNRESNDNKEIMDSKNNLDMSIIKVNESLDNSVNNEEKKDDVQDEEHTKAFGSRDKIVRTPPGVKK